MSWNRSLLQFLACGLILAGWSASAIAQRGGGLGAGPVAGAGAASARGGGASSGGLGRVGGNADNGYPLPRGNVLPETRAAAAGRIDRDESTFNNTLNRDHRGLDNGADRFLSRQAGSNRGGSGNSGGFGT